MKFVKETVYNFKAKQNEIRSPEFQIFGSLQIISLSKYWFYCIEKNPPKTEIFRWHKSFMSKGNLSNIRGKARPCLSEEIIEEVRQMFSDDPRLSIHKAATVLKKACNARVSDTSRVSAPYFIQAQNLHRMRKSDREDWSWPSHY